MHQPLDPRRHSGLTMEYGADWPDDRRWTSAPLRTLDAIRGAGRPTPLKIGLTTATFPSTDLPMRVRHWDEVDPYGFTFRE